MRMVDLIEKKRDGNELSKEEIKYTVTNYTNGKIPDHRVSALLMAISYQDMINEEITNLTLAIANPGDIIDLSSFEGVKVDKYSTGGVGDTTTLILAPLVASVGVTVAKMSGRGLGYTGGILDKLGAIPGFQTELPDETFACIVNESKVAVTGQSGNLASADKELYALRDVIATVDSLPLTASSTMSKKIAAEADAIVSDVITGDGASMKNTEDARRLAKVMTSTGKLVNRETMAVISDMSEPLGEAIGNNLEVVEAIETSQGNGPEDLAEMCYALGDQMVVLAGKAKTIDEVRTLLQGVLEPGEVLAKFRETIQNQRGDPTIVEKPERILITRYTVELPAKQGGVVSEIVADELGAAATMLGAGRKTKEDDIGHAVGLKLHKKIGDTATKDESLLTIYSNDEEISSVTELLYKNIEIGESAMKLTLIHDIITEQKEGSGFTV